MNVMHRRSPESSAGQTSGSTTWSDVSPRYSCRARLPTSTATRSASRSSPKIPRPENRSCPLGASVRGSGPVRHAFPGQEGRSDGPDLAQWRAWSGLDSNPQRLHDDAANPTEKKQQELVIANDGPVRIKGSSITLEASGTVEAKAADLKHDGVSVGKNHHHKKVMAGEDESGDPVS